jgi:hypothetical protein
MSEFVKVAERDEIPENGALAVEVRGRPTMRSITRAAILAYR